MPKLFKKNNAVSSSANQNAQAEDFSKAGAGSADHKARLRSEKKNHKAAKRAAKQQRRAKRSAQGMIDYDFMFENGVCQVCPGVYSKTIWFSDVNYQAARDEEQWRIFSKYCEMLNSIQGDSTLNISIVNHQVDEEEFNAMLFLKEAGDGLDDLRRDYNRILAEKSREGDRNNIARDRYLTVSTVAATLKEAIPKLARLESDICAQLRKVGCTTRVLDGAERLEVIANIFKPGEPFSFDYSDLDVKRSSLTTKDFISPNGFVFAEDDRFTMGDRHAQVLYISRYSPTISDRFLSDLADLPIDMTISLHVLPVDQGKAFDKLNRKLGYMGIERVNAQKYAAGRGLYTEFLSTDLADNIDNAEELIKNMRNDGEQMFKATALIMVTAPTLEELNDNVHQVYAAASKYGGMKIEPLNLQQKQGMNSVLPLGMNHVEIQRTHVTSSLGAMTPFSTQELIQKHPGAMYYGQNQLSNMLILHDRKTLDTGGSGFVLGKPGSGKSFFCKREILNAYLGNPYDEILIIDPEDEYSLLVKALKGENIEISAGSTSYLNPFDISPNYADEDNPFAFKAEFIQTICELLAGNAMGLDGITLSIVDRVVGNIYRDFDPRSPRDKMPTFVDFYRELSKQTDQIEAVRLAAALERFIVGQLAVFTKHTNVNTQARIVNYNTKKLGDHLKNLGMLVVLDQVWNRILYNYERGVRTWVYIDEAQTFFDNPLSMKYFDNIYARSRKYFGIPTGITQNVTRILQHEVGQKMLMNSDFLAIMNQSPNDARALTALFDLSEQQREYFVNADKGFGLLIAGSAIIPFKDKFPKGRIYDLITTKPDDVAERNRARFEELNRMRHEGIDVDVKLLESSGEAETSEPDRGSGEQTPGGVVFEEPVAASVVVPVAEPVVDKAPELVFEPALARGLNRPGRSIEQIIADGKDKELVNASIDEQIMDLLRDLDGASNDETMRILEQVSMLRNSKR